MPRNGGPLRCAPPTAPRSGPPPSPPSRALSTPRLKFRLDKIRGQRQPSIYAIWGLVAFECWSSARRRVVDQGLLVAVKHLISHGGDEGVSLALTTGPQFCQSVHDRLGGKPLLRRSH